MLPYLLQELHLVLADVDQLLLQLPDKPLLGVSVCPQEVEQQQEESCDGVEHRRAAHEVEGLRRRRLREGGRETCAGKGQI